MVAHCQRPRPPSAHLHTTFSCRQLNRPIPLVLVSVSRRASKDAETLPLSFEEAATPRQDATEKFEFASRENFVRFLLHCSVFCGLISVSCLQLAYLRLLTLSPELANEAQQITIQNAPLVFARVRPTIAVFQSARV